jgi:nicotinamide-nucleotide amidase
VSKRRAIILAVGTELTEGVIVNTHFRFLGSELKGLGFQVVRGEQIPDQMPLFCRALERAAAEAELVLVTGGLGPTSDDLTREAVADAAGVQLEFRPEVWEGLRLRYASSKQRLPETNRRQAFVPQGFELLANDWGTAPGFCGRIGDAGPGSPHTALVAASAEGRGDAGTGSPHTALVAALPGPPAELEPMFRLRLLPLLSRHFPWLASQGELAGTALLTPESALEESLIRHRTQEVSWSTRVAEDRIAFSLRGGLEADRERFLAALMGELGPVRIRRGELRPAERLFRLLEERGLLLALAESCTGGLLAKMLTDLPGSSRVFWGGAVAYSNAAKQRLLGVRTEILERYGAVSRQSAVAMADGLLELTPADLALSVTGIAGPEGGTPDKPVGTVWICARRRGGPEQARAFRFPGGRDLVRRRSAVAGLVLAECLLTGAEFPPVFPAA